jgi:predicted AAA+ superfamily ATPase
MTDHFKAIFKTDLDRNLNFTEETIEILDNKISVYDNNKNKILEIDNVERLDIEYGIGICKLIATDKNGKPLPKRHIFSRIKNHIDNFLKKDKKINRLIIIPGLRGTGKTTLLYQIYLYLIKRKNVSRERVLFISVDDLKSLNYDLRSCIDIYESKILFEDLVISEEPVFLLLDEVNHDLKWALTLKVIYDKYPNIFIIATGSSTLELEKETNADLARRAKKEYLFPLNFIEYLKISGKISKYPETSTFKNEILKLLNYDTFILEFTRKFFTNNEIMEIYKKIKLYSYEIEDFLKFGGFPFTALYKKDSEDLLLETIKKIAYSDIPKIKDVHYSSIENSFKIIYYLAGSEKPSIENISNDLKINKYSVQNILRLLEMSSLIFSIKPLGSEEKIIRKSWKYYFITPTIRFMIKDYLGTFKEKDIGFLLEEYIASTLYKIQNIYDKLNIRVFYDPHKNSADFLIKTNNNKMIPVEVKFGKDKNSEKQVRNSMRRYNAEYGIIIGDFELEFRDNILYMPKELFLIL